MFEFCHDETVYACFDLRDLYDVVLNLYYSESIAREVAERAINMLPRQGFVSIKYGYTIRVL